jgi:uncharacterized membrane protein YccC
MGAAHTMPAPASPDWISPALAAAGTVVVGFLGLLGVRMTSKAPKVDPQEIQNEGWSGLLDQMRLELKAASRERNHLNAVLEEERRSWREEREAWRVERMAFLGEIHQLQAVAEGFERLLRRYGFELPDRKVLADATKVVDVTLRQAPVGDDT